MTGTFSSVTIFLVRHAHAGSRSRWEGPDSERPLSKRGRAEAEAISRLLDGEPIDRVLSSKAVRCRQTVAPVAESSGVEVEVSESLGEGADPRRTSKLIWELAADGVHAVLSSHGDVIPATLGTLADDGVRTTEGPLPKGTLYRLSVEDGRITEATFIDPRP